jgi:hypothetical protein
VSLLVGVSSTPAMLDYRGWVEAGRGVWARRQMALDALGAVMMLSAGGMRRAEARRLHMSVYERVGFAVRLSRW